MKLMAAVLFIVSLSGCAYRFGSPEKRIPGGYNLVAIPVFKNSTHETGIEPFFTQNLIIEMQRSGLARITDKPESQAIILGEIVSIDYKAGTEVTSTNTGFEGLPQGSILAKEYRIIAKVKVSLVRSSDMALLWSGVQEGEKRYPAPIITREVLNTANPLYNHSAKLQNIQLLAKDMMIEAFDQMTENF